MGGMRMPKMIKVNGKEKKGKESVVESPANEKLKLMRKMKLKLGLGGGVLGK